MTARRIGRPPLEDRSLVRDKYVTVKVTDDELGHIRKLRDIEHARRIKRGLRGPYSVSRYLRDLITADAKRSGLLA